MEPWYWWGFGELACFYAAWSVVWTRMERPEEAALCCIFGLLSMLLGLYFRPILRWYLKRNRNG